MTPRWSGLSISANLGRTLLVLAALALACGGEPLVDETPAPSVTGSWAGPLGEDTLLLVLEEGSGTDVSGSGRLERTSPMLQDLVFNVSGAYDPPQLDLTLELFCALCPPAEGSYVAVVGEDAIQGRLDWESFVDEPLVLTPR